MLALLAVRKVFSLPFRGFRLFAPLLFEGLLANHRSLLAVSGRRYRDLTLFRSPARDILGGQFTQLLLRFGIVDSVGAPLQVLGLISQIDGSWRHGATQVEVTLGQGTDLLQSKQLAAPNCLGLAAF
jgi:hypothetical protein